MNNAMDEEYFHDMYSSDYFRDVIAPNNELRVVLFSEKNAAIMSWLCQKDKYTTVVTDNTLSQETGELAVVVTEEDCIEVKLKFQEVIADISFEEALRQLGSVNDIFNGQRLADLFTMSMDTVQYLNDLDGIDNYFTGLHEALVWTPYSDFPGPMK